MIRMMAADAITDTRIGTFEAGCADEALAILEAHPDISLVFTDVDLRPGLDGLSLAREINRRRSDVTFVVTSGGNKFANDELPDLGIFLPKPYQSASLVKLVRERLDHPDQTNFGGADLRSMHMRKQESLSA